MLVRCACVDQWQAGVAHAPTLCMTCGIVSKSPVCTSNCETAHAPMQSMHSWAVGTRAQLRLRALVLHVQQGARLSLSQLLLRQAAETGAARNELLDRRGDRASDAAARRQQRRAGSGAHRIGENLQGARSCGAGR